MIRPDDLPISVKLREALREWDARYNRILFDPNFNPSEMDPDAKIDWAEFDNVGVAIWKSLREELSGHSLAGFYSHRFSDFFEYPEDLAELLQADPNA